MYHRICPSSLQHAKMSYCSKMKKKQLLFKITLYKAVISRYKALILVCGQISLKPFHSSSAM